MVSVSLLATEDLKASTNGFACPDDYFRELYHELQALNSIRQLRTVETRYYELIARASKRPMDDITLFGACGQLAERTFKTHCSDYGYECPDTNAFNVRWPAQKSDWIPKLRENVPVLELCPDAYLPISPKLPIVGAEPKVTQEMIDEAITGWVVLELNVDEQGSVVDAVVTSSSSTKLVQSALEASRKFRFDRDGRANPYTSAERIPIAIRFTYAALAEAAGCPSISR